jgi:hypothetical protein
MTGEDSKDWIPAFAGMTDEGFAAWLGRGRGSAWRAGFLRGIDEDSRPLWENCP